jgi:hypothetical protein
MWRRGGGFAAGGGEHFNVSVMGVQGASGGGEI